MRTLFTDIPLIGKVGSSESEDYEAVGFSRKYNATLRGRESNKWQHKSGLELFDGNHAHVEAEA